MHILDTKQPPVQNVKGLQVYLIAIPEVTAKCIRQFLTDRAGLVQRRCPERASADEGTLKPVAEQDRHPPKPREISNSATQTRNAQEEAPRI